MLTLSGPARERPGIPAVLAPAVKQQSFAREAQATIQIFVLLPGATKPSPLQVAHRSRLGELRNKIAALLGSKQAPSALSLVYQGRTLAGPDATPVSLSAQSQVHVRATLPGGTTGKSKDPQLSIEGLDSTINVSFDHTTTLEDVKRQLTDILGKNMDNVTFHFCVPNSQGDQDKLNASLKVAELVWPKDAANKLFAKIMEETNDKKPEGREVDQLEQFFRDIPFYAAQKLAVTQKRIHDILNPDQQQTCRNLSGSKITTAEGRISFLSSLSQDQMETLATYLQENKRDQYLAALLNESDEWHHLWPNMIKKMSKPLKDRQILKLRSQLGARAFNAQMIFKLLGGKQTSQPEKKSHMDDADRNSDSKEASQDKPPEEIKEEAQQEVEKDILDTLAQSISLPQKVALLYNLLEQHQIAELYQTIEPHTVRDFWQTLSQEKQLTLYRDMKQEEKMKIFTGEYKNGEMKQRLTALQKKQLWTNLTQEERQQLWKNTDKRRIITQLTMQQIQELWLMLPVTGKKELWNILSSRTGRMQLEFWDSLNFSNKKYMLDQFTQDNLETLFKLMGTPGKMELLDMVNERNEHILKNLIDEELEREMFFYSYFGLKEQGDEDRAGLISKLVDDHTTAQSQTVPFARFEGGFCQVITNPAQPNGFITVQVAEKFMEMRSHSEHDEDQQAEDEFFTEVEEDKNGLGEEDPSAPISHSERTKVPGNRKFQVCQNRYGTMFSEQASRARNAAHFGMIAFWEHTEQFGFRCKHSFLVEDPVAFKCRDQSVERIILYKGKNGEVFFFFKREIVDSLQVQAGEANCEISCAILNLDLSQAGRGEQAKSVQENCLKVYKIKSHSELEKYVLNGIPPQPFYNNDVYWQNPLPQMVKNENDNYTLVFTNANNDAPFITFYDLELNAEVDRIKQAEIFVDLVITSKKKIVYFIAIPDMRSSSDSRVKSVPIQSKEYPWKLYCQALNLDEDFESNTDTPKTVPMSVTDDEKFLQERYFRGTPIDVRTEVEQESGKLLSFTLLFKHSHADTYCVGRETGGQEGENQPSKQPSSDQLDFTNQAFRCIYRTPDAQEFVHDHKFRYKYIQVLRRNEQNLHEDHIQEQNQVYLQLYDISNVEFRRNSRQRMPPLKRVKIFMKSASFRPYLANNLGSRYNASNILSMPTAIQFGEEESITCAVIHELQNGNVKDSLLHWVQSSMQQDRQNLIVDKIVSLQKQTHMIDYPLLAYKGFDPSNRELVIANLADRDQHQVIVNLFEDQFVCFVGHAHREREAKICFLVIEDQQVKLCEINSKQPFKKRRGGDFSDFTVVKSPIPGSPNLLKKITEIKRAELVGNPLDGLLVVQMNNSIEVIWTSSGKERVIAGPEMVKVTMQRGFNNQFYFVKRALNAHKLVELTSIIRGGDFFPHTKEIYQVNEGHVIGLEMDPENCQVFDTNFNHQRDYLTEKVINQLYIVTDQYDVQLLRERQEVEAYELMETCDLSQIDGMPKLLETLKQRLFERISLTQRCITLLGTNFNLKNGYSWDIQVPRASGHGLCKEACVQETDQQIEHVQNVEWTMRQVGVCSQSTRQGDRTRIERFFVCKPQPGSRRICIMGNRSLRDLVSINYVSEDRVLCKFAGPSVTQQDDYWAIITKKGEIMELPQVARSKLTWEYFSCGQSSFTTTGCFFMLRGGKKETLSGDFTYQEREIVTVEFGRNGEAVQMHSYSHMDYHDNLQKQIEDEMINNSSLREGFGSYGLSFSREDAKKVAGTLALSKQVLCTTQNDVYKIGTVVCGKFNDEMAINLMQVSDKEQLWSDEISVGLFLVRADQYEKPTQMTRHRNKDLKIIVMLCKTESDQRNVLQTGFCIVGDSLCWKYPKEKVIHTLKLQEMNAYQLPSLQFVADLAAQAAGMVKQQSVNILKQYANISLPNLQNSDDEDSASGMEDEPSDAQQSLVKRENMAIPSSYFETSNEVASGEMLQVDVSALRRGDLDTAGPAVRSKTNLKLAENQTFTQLKWVQQRTRCINLSVMMEQEDDALLTTVGEVPRSTQFSIDRQASTSSTFKEKLEIKKSLLQVTVNNRCIVYDLGQDSDDTQEPDEYQFLNATQQFVAPETFVDCGLLVVLCNRDPQTRQILRQSIVSNRSKDNYLARQEKFVYSRDKREGPLLPVVQGMFQTHAEIDAQELNRINKLLENQRKLVQIDLKVLNCVFDAHTIFSIFSKDTKLQEQLLNQLLNQLQELELDEEMDYDESALQNNFFRKMFRVLNLPTPDMSRRAHVEAAPAPESEVQGQALALESSTALRQRPSSTKLSMKANEDLQALEVDEEEENDELQVLEGATGLKSILRKSLFIKSARTKELIIAISHFCNECTIDSFAENQEQIAKMLENLSQSLLDLIQDSFKTTAFTQKILNVRWHPDQTLITFRKRSTIITEAQCNHEVESQLKKEGLHQQDMVKTQVEVRMLNLSWLFKDKMNFVDFVSVVSNLKTDAIYSTELLSILLDAFWEENKRKIQSVCFFPYLGYFLSALFFMIQCMDPNFQTDYGDYSDYILYSLTTLFFVSLIYQVRLEVKNFIYFRMEYFNDPFNWVDVVQMSSNLIIVVLQVTHSPFPNVELQRTIAAIASLLLWIKMLDWLRLFDATSFYVHLIISTLRDVLAFIIMFMVALLMIGTSLYILNFNRAEDDSIIDNTFGFWLIDAALNQYLLSLGEFSFDNYTGNPQGTLCWLFFLLATFLTQITFLNMIIAIMGDTFEKTTEQRERYSMQTRLSIMGSLTPVIQSTRIQEKEFYLYVVTPKNIGNDDEGSWDGQIASIKKSMDKHFVNTIQQVKKRGQAVIMQGQETKARDQGMEKELRSYYLRIMERFQRAETDITNLEEQQVQSHKAIADNIEKVAANNATTFKTRLENQLNRISDDQERAVSDFLQKANAQNVHVPVVNVDQQASVQDGQLSQGIKDKLASFTTELTTSMASQMPDTSSTGGSDDIKRGLESLERNHQNLGSRIEGINGELQEIVKREVGKGMSELTAGITQLNASQATLQAQIEQKISNAIQIDLAQFQQQLNQLKLEHEQKMSELRTTTDGIE